MLSHCYRRHRVPTYRTYRELCALLASFVLWEQLMCAWWQGSTVGDEQFPSLHLSFTITPQLRLYIEGPPCEKPSSGLTPKSFRKAVLFSSLTMVGVLEHDQPR